MNISLYASHLKTIKVIALTNANNKRFGNAAYLRRDFNRSHQTEILNCVITLIFQALNVQ